MQKTQISAKLTALALALMVNRRRELSRTSARCLGPSLPAGYRYM
jgi:hypothetical protein